MNNIPQITIGVDLGDTKHHYCVLDQAGNILRQDTLGNNQQALRKLAQEYPGARVAIEVGTHSPWVSDLLAKAGLEVFVANARKLRAVYENERKCDSTDAVMLARIARLDTELLKPIRHISQEAMADRLILANRDRLVAARMSLIQSVRSSVKSLGHRIDSGSPGLFPRRVREALEYHPLLLASLQPMLSALESINLSIAKLDIEITRLGTEKYPMAQKLAVIQGVGPITSLAFVLAIEDPARIPVTRDVGAYFGLVPRRDQSGKCDKALGISKTGNEYVRKLLVQCAQYIMGPHAPESDLRSFGLKLAERGGKATKKKAIVAVARKLAVIMLSLWKSGQDYQPTRGLATAG